LCQPDPPVAVLGNWLDGSAGPGDVAYADGGPLVCTTLVVTILPPVTVAVPW
jgi:hypothetical protein